MVDTKAPSLEHPGAVSHSYRKHDCLVSQRILFTPFRVLRESTRVEKPKLALQCNEIFSSRESTAVIVCEKQKKVFFCESYYDMGPVKRHG